MQVRQRKPHRFQRPTRCAVSPAEAAPYILVWVDKYGKTVFTCFHSNLADVFEVILIINSRPGMLDGLPGDQQAHKIKAPTGQAGEVFAGFIEGERSAHKG